MGCLAEPEPPSKTSRSQARSMIRHGHLSAQYSSPGSCVGNHQLQNNAPCEANPLPLTLQSSSNVIASTQKENPAAAAVGGLPGRSASSGRASALLFVCSQIHSQIHSLHGLHAHVHFVYHTWCPDHGCSSCLTLIFKMATTP